MELDEFERLVAEARDYTRAKLAHTQQEYGLGKYARYDLDLERATLRFSDADGQERVTARIQVAGSLNSEAHSWMWSWENESIPAISKQRLDAVREFGAKEDLPMLRGTFSPCTEVEAWAMCALAGKMLSAEGFYRAPSGAKLLFLLLFEIKKGAKTER